jgi:hypothetical protein
MNIIILEWAQAVLSCTAYIPAESVIVDVGKCCHENLAVKAVHDPSVPRDQISKVLQDQ